MRRRCRRRERLRVASATLCVATANGPTAPGHRGWRRPHAPPLPRYACERKHHFCAHTRADAVGGTR
eukprot:6848368-Prymnesium_polylepis.1